MSQAPRSWAGRDLRRDRPRPSVAIRGTASHRASPSKLRLGPHTASEAKAIAVPARCLRLDANEHQVPTHHCGLAGDRDRQERRSAYVTQAATTQRVCIPRHASCVSALTHGGHLTEKAIPSRRVCGACRNRGCRRARGPGRGCPALRLFGGHDSPLAGSYPP